MDQKLNARQQELYDAIQIHGHVKKGQGFRFTTARALAARALVTLEERRDAGGTLYYWVARRSTPTPVATPAPVETTAPPATISPLSPKGTHAIRVAVRNPETRTVTFTGISHVQGAAGLAAELAFLGVPATEQPHGTGGQYTTEDGTRRYVWRELRDGAVHEFVWGGEVFRVQPDRSFPDTWAVVMADTDEVVAADRNPQEAEARAKADLISLNQALAPRNPNK